VAGWVARQRRRTLDPQHGLGLLDTAAWDLLHGQTSMDTEQWLQEITAVTV